jgi:hypothetical protein
MVRAGITTGRYCLSRGLGHVMFFVSATQMRTGDDVAAFVEKDRLVKGIEEAIDKCDGFAQCPCPLYKLLDDIENGFYDWSGE